ncbi:ParB/RepB/Spo0J family partition protein [Muribaculum sp.]|uniref:ParB/RepB/Spo0J family partition protein n=1 Tax=Muribaculum sp. TaxID=1918611 RepID=UPI0023C7E5A9|nr:ParB/RepB/Spo0J family partition protein [Muribaculum sp.]MDE5704977.1 ParB/RepB/Spo0J family partition protein [Muribaculum sp.]
MPPIRRNALGRGLDSLISMDDVPARGSSAINDIDVTHISPNPDQPRTTFDEEALDELAVSIRELGIIQPLSLRKTGPDAYQIIAGERRYRAAIKAGLTSVPAYIRTANDSELTEMALIENIQREDLNAIEIALTFKKLIDQYQLTQERLSERIGKKRATIANFLRLLKLPAEVQLGLRDKRVDMGHARALLSIDKPALQLKLYNEILRHGLSVRKVEELAKAYREADEAGEEATAAKKADSRANDYDILKKHLSASFRRPVQFTCNAKGKGKITFPFKNEDELEQLIAIFDTIKHSEG